MTEILSEGSNFCSFIFPPIRCLSLGKVQKSSYVPPRPVIQEDNLVVKGVTEYNVNGPNWFGTKTAGPITSLVRI